MMPLPNLGPVHVMEREPENFKKRTCIDERNLTSQQTKSTVGNRKWGSPYATIRAVQLVQIVQPGKNHNTFSGRNHTAALFFALSLHMGEYKLKDKSLSYKEAGSNAYCSCFSKEIYVGVHSLMNN